MSRDPRLYLEDIIESATRILKYSDQMDFQAFLSNPMAYDAILRNLEIVGEAVKNLPSALTGRYPHVHWREIAGLRNLVAHEYFGLEDETLWSIVQVDVPRLLGQVKEILEQEDRQG